MNETDQHPIKLKPLIMTMTVCNITQGRVTRICMPFVITKPYQTLFVFLEEIKRVFLAEQPSSTAEINTKGATAAPSYRDWLVEAPH